MFSIPSGLGAEVPAQDPELVRQALTIVNTKDPVERQIAMLQVYNRELFIELARNEKDIEVRRTAILLLQDQEELKRLAVAPQALIREVAVMGIADERFLLGRMLARDEASPTVRAALVGALVSQPGLAEAAQSAYYGDVREAAGKRVSDAALVDRVRAAQATIAREAQAIATGDAAPRLVELAVRGNSDAVAQAAARRLASQDDLAAVALAATDRDVLKIVLGKLSDSTLLGRVAQTAVDVPMRLAAAQKANSRSWAQIFSGVAGRTPEARIAMGNALAAVALFEERQSEANAGVTQVCLEMIRQGDESRIPEMSDLLMLYGDTSLAEDYLNCGQPDLDTAGRRWASAHGFGVGTGNGSNRARWGGGR